MYFEPPGNRRLIRFVVVAPSHGRASLVRAAVAVVTRYVNFAGDPNLVSLGSMRYPWMSHKFDQRDTACVHCYY
jgi:hypothetical protein